MENNTENNGGLSAGHVKQLEEFLGTIMSNQEVIIEQNNEMLSANRNGKIFTMVKYGIMILLVFGSVFFMPQILSKMTEEITSSMGLGEMIGGAEGGDVDIEKLLNQAKQMQGSELEQLLK